MKELLGSHYTSLHVILSWDVTAASHLAMRHAVGQCPPQPGRRFCRYRFARRRPEVIGCHLGQPSGARACEPLRLARMRPRTRRSRAPTHAGRGRTVPQAMHRLRVRCAVYTEQRASEGEGEDDAPYRRCRGIPRGVLGVVLRRGRR